MIVRALCSGTSGLFQCPWSWTPAMKRYDDARLEPLFRRFSCRRYSDDQVPSEDRKALREALRWAPSAGNVQPWMFFEVANPEMKGSLAAAACDQDFIAKAPLVISNAQ